MAKILGDIPSLTIYSITHSGDIVFYNRHVQIMEGYITAVEDR